MNGIDARREDAREHLSRAFADGRLDSAQYTDLMERVGAAGTIAEIASCTDDRTVNAPSPQRPTAADRSIVTVLGSRNLRGDWLRERYATSITLLGQTTLDLRDCELPQDLTIHLVSIMGECRVSVPSDVSVINSVTPLLAEVNDRVPATAGTRRTIRITGVAIMSEVRIDRTEPRDITGYGNRRR